MTSAELNSTRWLIMIPRVVPCGLHGRDLEPSPYLPLCLNQVDTMTSDQLFGMSIDQLIQMSIHD